VTTSGRASRAPREPELEEIRAGQTDCQPPSGNAQVINATRPLDSAADADPVPDDAWGVWVRNDGNAGQTFQVFAICDN